MIKRSHVSALVGFSGRLTRVGKRLVSHPKRHMIVDRLLNHADWLIGPRVPEIKPDQLIPGLSEVSVTVEVGEAHRFELPIGERALLAAITTKLRPMTIFEIGTFTGNTTRLLANAMAPDGQVHTLDLPPGENPFNPNSHLRVGEGFRDDPEYAGRITQHWGDSRTFDFSKWEGSIDLVYVDGSHEYEDVIRDSNTALRLVSKNGAIIWDDYHYRYPGVLKALNGLGHQVDMCNLFRTRLVVHLAAG